MKNDRTRYYNRLGEAATKLCAALGRARSADEDRLRVWHKFKGEIEQSIAGHRVALVLVLVPHRGEKPTARGTWGPDLGLGIKFESVNDQGEVHLVTVGSRGERGQDGPSWDAQDVEHCELDVAGTLAALGTSDDLETTLLVAHEELARLVGDGLASAGKAFPRAPGPAAGGLRRVRRGRAAERAGPQPGRRRAAAVRAVHRRGAARARGRASREAVLVADAPQPNGGQPAGMTPAGWRARRENALESCVLAITGGKPVAQKIRERLWAELGRLWAAGVAAGPCPGRAAAPPTQAAVDLLDRARIEREKQDLVRPFGAGRQPSSGTAKRRAEQAWRDAQKEGA